MKGIFSKALNLLLFFCTLIAGLLWWAMGEVFFALTKINAAGFLRNPLLNGVYFAALSLFTIGACLFSESRLPSMVDGEFFRAAVMGPPLKWVLPFVFVLMLLAAGALEFVYEFDPAPVRTAQKTQRQPAVNNVPEQDKTAQPGAADDYYFLLDNSSSMTWNDKNDERIKLLGKVIDNLSAERKIALVSFNDSPTIHLRPQLAAENTKKQFRDIINNLTPDSTTNIYNALNSVASILETDPSRGKAVIFISDGEDHYGFSETSPQFTQVMTPFLSAHIPVHTIFLTLDNAESGFLMYISTITGGSYSSVQDPLELETQVVRAMNAPEITLSLASPGERHRTGGVFAPEARRDLLDKRQGKRQDSIAYILVHIVCITLTGLLLGYLIYEVFSNRSIFRPLVLGGGISGLLAALVLETGLQTGIWPAIVTRLLACVILSTLIWPIALLYDVFNVLIKHRRPVLPLFDNLRGCFKGPAPVLTAETKGQMADGAFDVKEKKPPVDSGEGKFGK